MRNFILLFILSCFTFIISAQEQVVDSITVKPVSKSIFLELGGNSFALGINFDSRLKKETLKGPGLRFGIGQYFSNDNIGNLNTEIMLFSFPIEYNYIFSEEKKWTFIAGVGLMPTNLFVKATGSISSSIDLIPGLPNIDFDIPVNASIQEFLLLNYFSMGFRFRPVTKNGFMFQINLTPIFHVRSISSGMSMGISLGYGFR